MSDALNTPVSIISSNVKNLMSLYSKENVKFPSLNEPFNPTAIKATRLAIAAAAQLIATLGNPGDTVRELTPSMYLSATIGFVVDVDVPDILAKAAPEVHYPIKSSSFITYPESADNFAAVRTQRNR